jgi:hypothetical protein
VGFGLCWGAYFLRLEGIPQKVQALEMEVLCRRRATLGFLECSRRVFTRGQFGMWRGICDASASAADQSFTR